MKSSRRRTATRRSEKKALEKMSVPELSIEAIRLLLKNERALARVTRQVSILARGLNIHITQVK